MEQITERRLYAIETAIEVASNVDRNGQATILYKTKRGPLFFLRYWQGERDHLKAVTEEKARELYKMFPERKITFVETFGKEPE